ncbi:MAG: Gfo/Idh/MocA family oxidoreductase [Balneolaceae bacterium]|nr:Gfo/Idh/MocA family oxidoreductase [Balneolaceae bacterium]
MSTRRQFLTNSGKIMLGFGASSILPSSSFSILSGSANEKLVVGLIGCKGMGWNNLQNLLRVENVECKALCDVDQNVLDQRAAEFEKMTGQKAELYNDYRRMLEDDDIDAVIIATPDHWHCLQTVHACQAGKDVYVEKPLGKNTDECDIMVKAARQTNSVVQVGQWQRSGKHWNDAIQFLQSGSLGNIRVTKSWAYQGWMESIPVKPDQPVPEGVDYDFWLGPAPERPFNPNRFHFNFRWYWDYAGGLMTDWGVHLIDIILYGMNVDAPNTVMSTGGKYGYPNDAMETPDTQQAIYEFDDFSMIWEHAAGIDGGPYGRNHGVAFVGNNGTLVIDRAGWEVLSEMETDAEGNPQKIITGVETTQSNGEDLYNHMINFVDCIKTRERPNADIALASNTAVVANLGNIAYRTGERLEWDHQNRKITNVEQPNELLKSDYRDPWKFPVL